MTQRPRRPRRLEPPERPGSPHRRHVDLPGGRRVYGREPGGSAVTLDEHDLRDELARHLGGITEAVLPYGRADVLTRERVIEVEPATAWQHAVRQVLAYSAQCERLPPAVALFGAADHLEVERIYKLLRVGPPPVELWWHSGLRWELIDSLRACGTRDWPGAVQPDELRPGYGGAR